MGKTKILVVEDHPDCRELVTIVLQRSGYVIFKAGTGLEAMEQAHATNPDLILMDFGLPDMSGDKVITRLKADPSTQKIPVILTTGYMDARVTKLANAAGAATILLKPFSLERLTDAMEECLSSEPDTEAVPLEPAIVGERLHSE